MQNKFFLLLFSLSENQLRFQTFSTNHTLSISYYCVKFRARRQVTEVGFAAQSTKGNSPISANLYNAVCGQTWQGGTVVGWQLRAQPFSYRMITVFLHLQYPYFLPRITDKTTTSCYKLERQLDTILSIHDTEHAAKNMYGFTFPVPLSSVNLLRRRKETLNAWVNNTVHIVGRCVLLNLQLAWFLV